MRRLLPLQRLRKSGAAVELAVRRPMRVPGIGSDAEVSQDALPLHVVVQPRLQPRPRAGQRLVGQLERFVVARYQSGVHEQPDEPLVIGTGRDHSQRHPAPHRLALGRGSDQPEQQVAQHRPLLRRNLLVHVLG